MKTKVCSKCGRDLPLDKYGNDKKKIDGLNIYCRECVNEKSKRYRINNKDKRKETLKRYSIKNKDKIAEYNKKYLLENPDKRKETIARYYDSNKTKLKLKSKEYREENSDRVYAWNKKWKSENKDKVNIYSNRRKAKKNLLPSSFSAEQWNQVKSDFNNKCAYCGEELPLEQEHFIAVNKGGEFTINNIVPSCRCCNGSKNDKDFFLWYPEYKFYSKERKEFILTYLNYKEGSQQLKMNI